MPTALRSHRWRSALLKERCPEEVPSALSRGHPRMICCLTDSESQTYRVFPKHEKNTKVLMFLLSYVRHFET